MKKTLLLMEFCEKRPASILEMKKISVFISKEIRRSLKIELMMQLKISEKIYCPYFRKNKELMMVRKEIVKLVRLITYWSGRP